MTTDPILRLPAVIAMTGLSRTTIYELMERRDFPLGVKLVSRARGWRQSSVQRWINARKPMVDERPRRRAGRARATA